MNPVIKIGSLHILRYRDVAPGTRLRFDERVNLLVGGSGSGKTTLLGLLAAVVGSDFSRLEDEAFALEYEVSDGTFSARVAVSSEGRAPQPAADEPPAPIAYAYHVRICRLGAEQICELVGTPTSLVARAAGGESQGPPSPPFRRGFLAAALRQPPAAALVFPAWHLFNWSGTAARFDESLDCFLAMTGRSPALAGVAGPAPAEAVFAFDPRSTQRHSAVFATHRYLPGGAIGRAIVEAHRGPAGETRVPGVDDGGDGPAPSACLGFLQQAARVMGFHAATFHPDVLSYRYERATDTHVYAVRGFTFRFARGDGVTLHHDLLSHGQRRLLAFLYYLAASEQFVIADELLGGMHPRWFGECLQAIGQRQVFATCRDPVALGLVGLDSLARVEARVITCEVVDADGRERMAWRNIGAVDAGRFFVDHARALEGRGLAPASRWD